MKNFTFTLIFVISSIWSNAQVINFPDANFKAKLLAANSTNYIAVDINNNSIQIDANSNSEIEVSEALTVYGLNVNYQDAITGETAQSAISSLNGVEYFVNLNSLNCSYNTLTVLQLNLPNLHELNCSFNLLTNLSVSNPLILNNLNYEINQLSNLDFSQFPNLTSLNCGGNQITSLNVSQVSNLTSLNCGGNQITSLNVSNLTGLEYLDCSSNLLTNLNVTSNLNLAQIYCNNNQLTSLLLPNNTGSYPYSSGMIVFCQNNLLTNLSVTKVMTLFCSNNLLTNIDFLYPEIMNRLICRNNNFTSLDLSSLTKTHITGDIDVSNNSNLVFLSIKNGLHNIIGYNNTAGTLYFSNCPNLEFICVDEIPNEIAYVQSRINTFGYTSSCQVSSYCSFVPGGQNYTIHGQHKLDNQNDGCDSNDSFIPNLKFSISDGTTTGSVISDNSGNYSITVQAGTYTISPVFENPSYFTISPANVVVSFPSQTSPFNQNFCITANGTHDDVEVSILPMNVARPGFDSNYKIICKNKGNQTENGTINFQFNDAILDFVSANPAFNSQTINNLNWTYSNLLPFETRSIYLTLNVNSSMETPAVNAGDVLNYTVINTIEDADEMPSDNTFTLNQTVVNSYDPNDKTCLQGNYIGPDKVGEYVHYVIRFENTGTFPAENIVVKDMIDTTKFDVSSLVPLHASHNFFTRITGNKVEFIFENINLPFDDANNDGYIAFKIKTLPSLVVGNTFSNSANIYFDYNFPIVTNTATTTIAALNNPSVEFSNNFSIYPNPAKNELHINLKQAIEINSIQIYNTIGQLVMVQTGNALHVDVSNLKTGNYFIKINTTEGFSTSQFIKE